MVLPKLAGQNQENENHQNGNNQISQHLVHGHPTGHGPQGPDTLVHVAIGLQQRVARVGNLLPLAPQVRQNVGANGLRLVGDPLRVADPLRRPVQRVLARQKLLSLVQSDITVGGRSVSKQLVSGASLFHVGQLFLGALDRLSVLSQVGR